MELFIDLQCSFTESAWPFTENPVYTCYAFCVCVCVSECEFICMFNLGVSNQHNVECGGPWCGSSPPQVLCVLQLGHY